MRSKRKRIGEINGDWINCFYCIFKQRNTVRALSRAIRHCSADYYPIYCPGFCLSYASLSRTVLSHAILTGTDLSKAHLSVADLTEADLRFAVLNNTNINGTILTGALLTEKQIQMLGYEKLSNCYFEKIKIGSSSDVYSEYPRKQFFTKFFHKQ